MEKEFKCVTSFAVSKYDEHERLIENEEVVIPVGSFWTLWDSVASPYIRLEGGRLGWVDVDEATLKSYFEEV